MSIRGFTEDEISLVQSIFGDELPESVLRKYEIDLRYREKKPDHDGFRVAMDCNGYSKKINAFGRKYHSKDYSHTEDAFNFGAFIHESTHAWQYLHQNERSNQTGYNYELFAGCHLSDFGLEQQPSIVEDYVRVYLFNGYAPPWRTGDTPGNRELLKTVVEERFPEARKTRERLEAEAKKARLKRIFNAASGIIAKLDDMRDEAGTGFKYDIVVVKGGQKVIFNTNVPNDSDATGQNPTVTIVVDSDGDMGIAGEKWSTEEYILDTVEERAWLKELIKSPALDAAKEARLEFIYGVASGIKAKLDEWCAGSELKYDIDESKTGRSVSFCTNIPRDDAEGSENPAVTIVVNDEGKIGIIGESWSTAEHVIESAEELAWRKGLIDSPALDAAKQARLEFVYGVASGIKSKLDELCDGSDLKYDIVERDDGGVVFFNTNVPRDFVATGEKPMVTIFVREDDMAIENEKWGTEEYILDNVERRARQKGLIKASALNA
jgi:hypothetical protein